MTGTHLESILHLVGLKPCPDCHDHAETMNQWGQDGCERNLEIIVGWLEESAKNQGVFFWKPGARWLVRLAIAMAKRGKPDLLESDLDEDTPKHIREQFHLDKAAESARMPGKE